MKTAESADKLTNYRSIRLTGQVTGSGQFNGGSDLSINTSLSSTATVNNFSGKHTGSYLGFFNGSISSKRSVSALGSPSTAAASTIASKLNELINALKAYNLV